MNVPGRPRGYSSQENDVILAMRERGADFAAIGRRLGRSGLEIEAQLGRIRRHGVAACSASGGDRAR